MSVIKTAIFSVAGIMVLAAIAMLLFPGRVTIGPANPGAENGSDQWWVGTGGKGYLFVDQTDPASGTSDFTLGVTNVDEKDSAGWRSVIFPLGPAASGARPITFSFAYKLPGEVNSGDNTFVQLRFYNRATNWIVERDFLLGESSHDSAMSRYKTVTVDGILAPHNAAVTDINVTANFFGHHWSSGDARFDDFSVTTIRFSRLAAVVIFATGLLILIAAGLSLHSKNRQQ